MDPCPSRIRRSEFKRAVVLHLAADITAILLFITSAKEVMFSSALVSLLVCQLAELRKI